MKTRDIFSNRLAICGFACLLLGIGNWAIGAVETSKYYNLLHKSVATGLEDSYRSFQQLDHQKNEEVLQRINEGREKYNAARVKLHFFYVVLVGGRVLFLLGAALLLATLIRLIRYDALQKIKNIDPMRLNE